MPAKYIDMGSVGSGVSFPGTYVISNRTKDRLSLLGLEKQAWTRHLPQVYTGFCRIETIIHFIKAYNHEQFPQHQPTFVAYPPQCGDEALLKRARLRRSDRNPVARS